jgi:DNA end-binding protein Ku
MARSMWSGSISFGLVNVPVKLFTAVSQKDIHFHQLHDADGVRIQMKRICPADGKEVPYEHIVKGYEISPDRYVMIKPKELEALDPKATHTIDIESFAKLSEIDPLYYDHPYYLVPDKGAGKAYSLLQQAMLDTKTVAIARAVIRTKQYIMVLRPTENALAVSTLYYADEVIPESSLEGLPSDIKLNEKEVAMARQLVDSLTQKFHPEKYHDDYRERVMKLIEQKAEGKEIAIQPGPAETPKVVNLMEALEASLAAARKGTATASASRPKAAPARKGTARKTEHRKRKTA